MKNLEESIYNKLIEKSKKPNPKDHTTLSLDDMQAAVQKAQSIKKVADDKKLAKNIPGDEYRKLPSVSDKFQIIVPMSMRASCIYGAGTKWCTAAAKKDENMFDRYYKRWGMTLYYILPKKVNPDWDVVSPEEASADEEEFAHFFTEGKVQDLQKKYPEWDISAFKDPSGKNKYLDWMVKTAVSIGDTKKYSTNRVNDLIADYHKLLPYIGREEKPEKKKEKGQKQERTRFDKFAIVMHPEGYRTKMYDAEDKEVDLKELISSIMPTWGIDQKEGLDVFGAVEDVIIDDMAESPNPVRARVIKIKGAVDSLGDDLNSNYHDNINPNFFNDPEKSSNSPTAYGTLKNTRVEPGELVIPYVANFYFPIPHEIGGYEKIAKDRTFRGNDRARLEEFKSYLQKNMKLYEPAVAMVKETFKSFDAAKEKYTKEIGESKANTIFKRQPTDAPQASTPEADIQYVGPVTKQRFIFMDLRMSAKIRDTVGAIDSDAIDDVMLNVVGDIRNFMEGDGINKVKEKAWDEFQFMAKRWMEQNPRKSPEKEKVEADKATDDIMDQLPEERQAMSLEEKILAKLMGEELLLEAVSYEQATQALSGKPAMKLVKRFNFDQGNDPMDNMSKLIDKLAAPVMMTVPNDILPASITNDPEMKDEKKKEEVLNRQAICIMWILRLLKKDKELAEDILGDNRRHRWQSVSRQLKQDMEKFFQHPRHMKVRSLDKIQTPEELSKVVSDAQKSIDAENDKKMGADAGAGTEFFAGGFKTDANGDIMRDEEGIPLFRFSKDGWVIAAAHNKGAACLLGKKTNWCTAAPGLNYFDTYYNGKDDPLFFIHTPSAGEGYDGDRFQFAFGCDDCPQFMDVEDTPVRGNEFEELHDKLKDVLRDNGFEDRFEAVFNYEHFDFHEAMDKLVTSERARIDNPQVQIHGDVDDDYDSTNLNGGFNVAFVYNFDPNMFTPVDDIHDYDSIINVFSEITNMHVGSQEDNYGEDGQENVDYDAGHSTVKLEIGGWMSSWASSESAGEDSMHEVNGFFSDVNSNIDGRYDELKGKLQVALVELGALPLTKYDKLLSDEINVWDGEHANQDDEDEEEEKQTAEEMREAFEEQFKNVLVAFDDELSEITFQGLSFPPPAELASEEVSIIGDVPKNKDYIFRRAIFTMKQVLDRQPNLPGMGESDDEAYLDMLLHVITTNDIVGYFFTFKSVCKLEIEMKLGKLTESEMDSVVEGMKVIDRNFKLFQIAMRDALERYIKMNPDEVRWAKDKPEPPVDPAAQGNAIGGRLGAPVRAEGLSEIVVDEVTKAMNEVEPYQKIAKRQQKKAMELSIKGPNKYMTKGMKIATAKPGKSAPPGV